MPANILSGQSLANNEGLFQSPMTVQKMLCSMRPITSGNTEETREQMIMQANAVSCAARILTIRNPVPHGEGTQVVKISKIAAGLNDTFLFFTGTSQQAPWYTVSASQRAL